MPLKTPIPILRSFDEAKAREFYVDFLEFRVDWQARFDENAPLYMQLSRDACVLHLSEHFGDCTPGSAITVGVDDVDELSRALLAKTYKHSRPHPHDTDWGSRDMTIADPFGNRITFFSRREPPAKP